MYVEFLHDWLDHWPRHQLLFLRNEDYAAATRPHMEAVFTFLGMREPTPAEWNQIMEMDRRNAQQVRRRWRCLTSNPRTASAI